MWEQLCGNGCLRFSFCSPGEIDLVFRGNCAEILRGYGQSSSFSSMSRLNSSFCAGEETKYSLRGAIYFFQDGFESWFQWKKIKKLWIIWKKCFIFRYSAYYIIVHLTGKRERVGKKTFFTLKSKVWYNIFAYCIFDVGLVYSQTHGSP